jgi:hypothetical protein
VRGIIYIGQHISSDSKKGAFLWAQFKKNLLAMTSQNHRVMAEVSVSANAIFAAAGFVINVVVGGHRPANHKTKRI